MKRAITISMVLALFAVSGCEEDKPPPPKPTTSAKPVASSTELTDEQIDKEALPVEEDFVAEADQQINEDNVDDIVTELEKEIGGTEPASDKKDDAEPDEDSFD